MGREILFLHFGQAGVQMGSALWELFCIEHQLTSDGQITRNEKEVLESTTEHIGAFFNRGQRTWTPRAVLVDLEPTVIDEIRTGPYRRLWKPSCLITGREDAANNYGRGNCTIGRRKLGITMEVIRKMVEESHNLAAFETIHSYSGGTGSGFTSLVVEHLCDEYGKKFKFSTSVFPSAMYSQSTVDPYNAILHSHSTIETLDCDILFDNQTMFDRCSKNLTIHQPSYTDINRLLAQMLSSVFLSHRFIFYGSQHADTTELMTNLIPYPRIHFPSLFYAPLWSRWQVDHDAISISELTRTVFSEDSRTMDFPSTRSAYISCAMLYRGVTSPKQIYDALKMVKGTASVGANFVDWCPTGFKIGLNTFPPVTIEHSPLAASPRSVCMLAGNLGMRHAWHRNNMKFDVLFSRRSFIHWFIGEGLEESEFIEARDDMAFLEQDYAELMGETMLQVEPVNHISPSPPRSVIEVPQPTSLQMERVMPQSSENATVHSGISGSQDSPDRLAANSNNGNVILSHDMVDGRNWSNSGSTNQMNRYGELELADWGGRMLRCESQSRSSHGRPPRYQQYQTSSPLTPGQQPRHSSRPSNQGEFEDATRTQWESNRSEIFSPQYSGGNRKMNMTPGHEFRSDFQPYEDDRGIDAPESTGATSHESGSRGSQLQKEKALRENNMNNARCSRTSIDTGFSPTEPMVLPGQQMYSDHEYTPHDSAEWSPAVSSQTIGGEVTNLKGSRCISPHRCLNLGDSDVQMRSKVMAPTGPKIASITSSMSAFSRTGQNPPTCSVNINRHTESRPQASSAEAERTELSSAPHDFTQDAQIASRRRTLQLYSVTSGLGSLSHAQSAAASSIGGSRGRISNSASRASSSHLGSEDKALIAAAQHHRIRHGRCHQEHHHHYVHHRHHHHHHHHHKHRHHRHHSHKRILVASTSSANADVQEKIVRMESSEVTNSSTVSEVGDHHTSSSGASSSPSAVAKNWSIASMDKHTVYEVSITDDEDDASTPILSAWSTSRKRLPSRTTAE